jgi:hypothetical protein
MKKGMVAMSRNLTKFVFLDHPENQKQTFKVFLVLLISILLIIPIVQAQTQAYSGFNRGIDNVKLFFSHGDNKVKLALDIREKEVNSAINNIQNNKGDDANKNLERAKNKIQIVQEKVSVDMVDDVDKSVNNVLDKIEQENLSDNLEGYILEEEKTKLITKLVIEVDGKEGQNLTRTIIKNETTGQKNVVVVVNGKEGQNLTKVIEIQKGINQINNNISEWVVEHTYAPGTTAGGEGSIVVVGGENEVKTHVDGDGTENNNVNNNPDLNTINPNLYDPNARAPGDTIDETYDDDKINNGNCGDGVVWSS